MKYLLIILTAILITSSAHAGYYHKIVYWYSQNVSVDIPKFKTIVHLKQPNPNEISSTVFDWKIQNPPSKAVLDAIDDAVAIAWVVDYYENINAEPEKSSIDAQALIDVIADITGTPIGQVKSKFKNAKKDKEKNK